MELHELMGKLHKLELVQQLAHRRGAQEHGLYFGQMPVLDFIAGNLLSNVIARPQFIAHGPGRKTALARFAEACGAMSVYWTARPGDDAAALEEYYDAVIFEHYAPKPKYK